MITITTQREWNELPELFDVFTMIEIRSEEWIRIRKTPEKSHVLARDSSRVVARDSSRVVARDSSRVEARDSSRVTAWEFSHVTARDSSRVLVMDSSHVVAWDSSRVTAWDSSHVEARDSSVCDNMSRNTQIQAGGNTTLYLKTEPSLIDCEDSVNIIRDKSH